MPRIIFITPSKDTLEVIGKDGESLMQAAVGAGVPDIDAVCGGVQSCATCHVYITPAWMERIGPAGEIEREMLEFDGNATDYSRLSCQIKLDSSLDGLVVEVVGR